MCRAQVKLEQKPGHQVELELKLVLSLELIWFSSLLLMTIIAVKAVELLTDAYSVTFRAYAFCWADTSGLPLFLLMYLVF